MTEKLRAINPEIVLSEMLSERLAKGSYVLAKDEGEHEGLISVHVSDIEPFSQQMFVKTASHNEINSTIIHIARTSLVDCLPRITAMNTRTIKHTPNEDETTYSYYFPYNPTEGKRDGRNHLSIVSLTLIAKLALEEVKKA